MSSPLSPPGLTAVLLACSMSLAAACSGPDEPGGAEPTLGQRIETSIDPYVAPEDPVRAVLALVNGDLVYERYFDSGRDEYRDVFSVTKSVMSTLVGIAIDEGLIPGPDATLARLLPAYASDMSAAVASTTLRQVLTMTGGFASEDYDLGWDFETQQEPVRRILSESVVAPPGKQFIYSEAGAHLVSPVLETATGMEVEEFARDRLFEPLGIPSDPPATPLVFPDDADAYDDVDFAWPVDRDGHNLGYGHLRLRPVDMAKLGQLYLQEGEWQGRQLVPFDWVLEATTNRVPSSLGESYGYFWWPVPLQEGSAYAAVGFGGQLVEVVPDLDLVIVVSTDVDLRERDEEGITHTHATQIADAVIAVVADHES